MTIIRTPHKVLGGITPEEKIALDAHTAKWITNAMSTEPVVPERLVPAIKALYAAADLKEPRVVIVDSPLVMAMAGGFAAAIWWVRKNHAKALRDGLAWEGQPTDAATRTATDAATRAATYAATDAATYAATYAATRAATYDATGAATDAATGAATDAATGAATYAATDAATYDATRAATDAATGAATDAATGAATYAATDAATDAATYDATDAATRAATYAATDAATYAATDAATDAATYAATYAATDAATGAATRAATDAATGARFASLARELASEFGVDPIFMLRCAQNWYRMYQGGNMWSYYDCYLSAFRDVLGLVLPEHEKYRAWEACAIEGGFRIVHEEFCIVSDRPEVLRVDNENRPHCENGPSHRWRDGWSLYYWHGVSIPGEWVAGKPPTAQEALTWPNIEQRRAAAEIVGWANILAQLDARVIDEDDPEIGTLLEANIPDSGAERFLKVQCGTGRTFCLPVPPDTETALAANMWTYGLDADTRFIPEVRT